MVVEYTVFLVLIEDEGEITKYWPTTTAMQWCACSTGGERVTACTAVQRSCDGQLITRRAAARGNYCSLRNEGWARGYPDIEMGRTLLKWHFWTRAASCVPKQIEF